MMPNTPYQWLLLLAGLVVSGGWIGYDILQKKFFGTQVTELLFSPDGERLYGGGINFQSPRKIHGYVWMWEVATGRLLKQCEVGTPVSHLSLAPDGTTLMTTGVEQGWSKASASLASGTFLWSTQTTHLLFSLKDKEQEGFFSFACFTPDSHRILGCSQQGIQIWDAHTGKQLSFWSIPEGKTGWPACLHFSADGTRLLVQANAWSDGASGAYGEAFVQLWDAHTGEILQDYPVDWLTCAALSPDGQHVVLRASRSLPEDAKGNRYAAHWLELHTAQGQKLSSSPEFPLYFTPESLTFQGEGNVLCQGQYSRVGELIRPQTFLWNVVTNQLTEQSAVSQGVVSPDGQRKAIINPGGYQDRPPLGTIYRVDTGEKICDLEGFAGR